MILMINDSLIVGVARWTSWRKSTRLWKRVERWVSHQVSCLYYYTSTRCLLNKVQSKAIRLINNPNLTQSPQPFSHRGWVGDRFFHGHCSQEIRDIIPVPLRRVRTTRRSTHSNNFQVSLPNPRTLSHKSSFIPRTCNLWNLLPPSCIPES